MIGATGAASVVSVLLVLCTPLGLPLTGQSISRKTLNPFGRCLQLAKGMRGASRGKHALTQFICSRFPFRENERYAKLAKSANYKRRRASSRYAAICRPLVSLVSAHRVTKEEVV